MSKLILALALAGGVAVAGGSASADEGAAPRGPETRHPNFYLSPTDEYEPPADAYRPPPARPAPRARAAPRPRGDGTSLYDLFRSGRFDASPPPLAGSQGSTPPSASSRYYYSPGSPDAGRPRLRPYRDRAPCPGASHASLGDLFACTAR